MAKTILVLAANPDNTPPLRLDREVREIESGLERARNRNEFILKQKWATRPVDVRRAMLDFRPSIVHFCGHGSGQEGIAFEDEAGQVRLVDADTLAEFFELFSNSVECVVLNACYSEVQAEALARHIPHVIGMRKSIGDNAAINFATAFYDALGAGETIEFAYKLGCNAIRWSDMPDNLIPVLKTTPCLSNQIKSTERPLGSFSLTPRLPCLLLLDISASMAGAPIKALQVGLRTFLDDLLGDPNASERVELALVTFGSHVAILRDFCPVNEFDVPDLSPAGGATSMGEALELGLDLIERRKQDYKSLGIAYYKPMILLFTDGEPTDEWHFPVNRLHRESALRRVSFYAVGLENADMKFLERISPGSSPIMIRQLRFSEMFLWLSASMRSLSGSEPKDIIDKKYPAEGEKYSEEWEEI